MVAYSLHCATVLVPTAICTCFHRTLPRAWRDPRPPCSCSAATSRACSSGCHAELVPSLAALTMLALAVPASRAASSAADTELSRELSDSRRRLLWRLLWLEVEGCGGLLVHEAPPMALGVKREGVSPLTLAACGGLLVHDPSPTVLGVKREGVSPLTLLLAACGGLLVHDPSPMVLGVSREGVWRGPSSRIDARDATVLGDAASRRPIGDSCNIAGVLLLLLLLVSLVLVLFGGIGVGFGVAAKASQMLVLVVGCFCCCCGSNSSSLSKSTTADSTRALRRVRRRAFGFFVPCFAGCFLLLLLRCWRRCVVAGLMANGEPSSAAQLLSESAGAGAGGAGGAFSFTRLWLPELELDR